MTGGEKLALALGGAVVVYAVTQRQGGSSPIVIPTPDGGGMVPSINITMPEITLPSNPVSVVVERAREAVREPREAAREVAERVEEAVDPLEAARKMARRMLPRWAYRDLREGPAWDSVAGITRYVESTLEGEARYRAEQMASSVPAAVKRTADKVVSLAEDGRKVVTDTGVSLTLGAVKNAVRNGVNAYLGIDRAFLDAIGLDGLAAKLRVN